MRRYLPVLALLACLHAPSAWSQSNVSPQPNVVGGCIAGTPCIVGAPAVAPPATVSGWTFIQDTVDLIQTAPCAAGNTACTITVQPTTAGTAWALVMFTGNTTSTTISSVTGGGGTWTHCTNCAAFLVGGRAMDASYNVGGTTGSTAFTMNISQAAGGFWFILFIELLPPAGSTPVFDTSGSASSASCTSCVAVPLTTSGTDVIIQVISNGGTATAWNAISAPYILDNQGEGVYLDTAVGSIPAPTFTQSSGNFVVVGLAFKSSLGSFTPTPKVFAVQNFLQTQPTCSPTCNITVPLPGANRLLFLWAGTNVAAHSVISSVTGNGTWVVDGTCPITITALNPTLSCAYVLSSSSSTTTLNVTMSATGVTGFQYWEVSRTSGAFAFDVSGAAQRPAIATGLVSGIDLTLTGTNDVIFQATWQSGSPASVTLYPIPFTPGTNGCCFMNTSGGSAAIRTDTADGTHPVWVTNDGNQANSASAVAIK